MDGEIRLFSDHFPEGTLQSGLEVQIGDSRVSEQKIIESVRWSNRFAIIRFKGVTDRGEAEQLTNLEVYADIEKLPDLPDDEFYRAQLIGAPVLLAESVDQDESMATIGSVKGFMETGANDVLTVELNSEETLNVPMIAQAVAAVDVDKPEIILESLDQWAPEGTDREKGEGRGQIRRMTSEGRRATEFTFQF